MSTARQHLQNLVYLAAVAISLISVPAIAQDTTIPIEIVELSLQSVDPVAIPFASDPNNDLGDSINGFGFVLTDVHIGLSNTNPSGGPMTFLGVPDLGAVPQGTLVDVDSILDIWVTITFTDVDARPGRDFGPALGGGPIFIGEPDSPWFADSFATCVFQAGVGGGGCVGQVTERSGIHNGRVQLGDINLDGNDDVLTFGNSTIATTHTGQTPLPGPGVPTQFRDGFASEDITPFSLDVNPTSFITTTGTFTLQYTDTTVVPIPPAILLLGSALVGLMFRRRVN